MLLHQEKKESEDYPPYRAEVWEKTQQGTQWGRRKSLNKIWEIKQKPAEDPEDPSQFLERIYQVYRCYTDTDPEAPENVRMINIAFIRQSAPEIKKIIEIR